MQFFCKIPLFVRKWEKVKEKIQNIRTWHVLIQQYISTRCLRWWSITDHDRKVSEEIKREMGVLQGDTLPPMLFTGILEVLMEKTLLTLDLQI